MHAAGAPLNLLSACLPTCPAVWLQWNLTGLVEMIFDYLKLIRIYTKPKGGWAGGRAGRRAGSWDGGRLVWLGFWVREPALSQRLVRTGAGSCLG
jgi:hypothetical protein